MKHFLAFLKATLLGGVIVVLPAWLAVLLMLQCISKWGGGSGKLVAAYDAASARCFAGEETNQQ